MVAAQRRLVVARDLSANVQQISIMNERWKATFFRSCVEGARHCLRPLAPEAV